MKTLSSGLVCLLCLSIVGCQTGGGSSGPHTIFPPGPLSEYREVSRDGRTYVLGNGSSVEALAAGQTPPLTVTRLGYGDKGETVIFEANKDGNLEKWLIAVYEKRHNKQP